MSLIVRGISAGTSQKMIIDAVDLEAPAGQVTALVGPNGAGKSTLLHAILGLPSTSGSRILRGTVTFDDQRLDTISRRAKARIAALVEQNVETQSDITVRRVVALGRTPHQSVFSSNTAIDESIIESVIDRLDLRELADRQFQTLSGGERQRALLAKALAQQPRLLGLDEPTNHLDVHAQLETLQLLHELAESGVTVLVALHDLNLAASHADRVIVLNHGRVDCSGAPEDVLTQETLRRVFRVEAGVIDHDRGRPLIAFYAPMTS